MMNHLTEVGLCFSRSNLVSRCSQGISLSCIAIVLLFSALGLRAHEMGGQTSTALESSNLAGAVSLAATVDEISFTQSQIIWKRVGNLPVFWETTFEFSTNGMQWTYLGEGTRVGSEWRIEGLAPLGEGTVRARGYLSNANGEPSNLFNEKRFEYTSASPVILQNRQSPVLTSGGCSFQIEGKVGQIVVVETSSDLVAWKAFPAKRLSGTPTWFADAEARDFPHRFYRVLPAP